MGRDGHHDCFGFADGRGEVRSCVNGLGQLEVGQVVGDRVLEVQLSFVRLLFPESKFLPIAVPPGPDAEELGRRIGELTRDRSCLAPLD